MKTEMGMGNDGDVGFTFDPKAFVQGVNTCTKSMGNLTEHTKNSAKDIGKAVFWAIGKIAMIGEAFKGVGKMVKSAVSYMPEITKTFDIAKDVFMKNFLWPVRQAIAPFLQKILNWTRDNRAQFVAWGQTVANIFTAGVHLAGQLWAGLSQIGKVLEPIMGASNGGMAERINLIMAKIAVLAEYIGRLLKPVMEDFGTLVNQIAGSGVIGSFIKLAGAVAGVAWDALAGFIHGFAAGSEGLWTNIKGFADAMATLFDGLKKAGIGKFFESLGKDAAGIFTALTGFITAFSSGAASQLAGVVKPLQAIMDAFKMLADKFFTPSNMAGMDKLLNFFGTVAGTAIVAGVKALASAVMLLVTGLIALGDLVDVIGNVAQGKWLEAAQASSKLGKGATEGIAGIMNMWSDQPKGSHAQGTPYIGQDGLYQLHAGETVLSPAQSRSRASGGPGLVQATIYVTEGSARQAGVNFGEGLQSTFRGKVLNSQVLEGR